MRHPLALESIRCLGMHVWMYFHVPYQPPQGPIYQLAHPKQPIEALNGCGTVLDDHGSSLDSNPS